MKGYGDISTKEQEFMRTTGIENESSIKTHHDECCLKLGIQGKCDFTFEASTSREQSKLMATNNISKQNECPLRKGSMHKI